MDDEADQTGQGAGSWSILGFDYQVDVSVWLALDVMVAGRLTEEMTLEHVSEEDLEADLEEFEPGAVSDPVPMHGYRLIVQAKRRTGNAWTQTSFLKLLNHGKRRKSAMARLKEDAGARYLLVTSAGLNVPVKAISVRRAGRWPPAPQVTEALGVAGKDIAGRVAIIGTQDDERLVSDIKDLLIDRFRVPRARWEECLKQLREAAWNRMRGLSGGRWAREEIEAVIAGHEGYLIASFEGEDYVRPTNWGDLTGVLDKHHALMLVGQSGSGKTATVDALWLDLKARIPDLRRVRITQGPAELAADASLPPVLYDIEDPWGRFKFEADSRPWNDQLAPAFHSARHDRLFIATSRTDVALQSGAIETIRRWRMPLDAENYGLPERQKLYRNLSKRLPADLKAFAHQRERTVLRQLSLPLELRKFFDALPDLDRERLAANPGLALEDAIARAHQDAIERTVVEQIEERESVKPAAIVWALIKPNGRLSGDVLRSLEDPLVDGDASLEDKLGQFVNGFVAGRNLRQGADGSLSYYHPRVEAGIEEVLARHPQAARRTLRLLVEALLVRDDDTGKQWGVETAAEIVRLSQRIPDLTPTLSRASQDRVDAWIEQALGAEGRELEAALRLAALVGSGRSDLAEFARWIEHRPQQEFPYMLDWEKPERDQAWYRWMRASPGVRLVAERFVRSALPRDSTGFPKGFAGDLAELAGDLTAAFVEAATVSVNYGYIRNDDTIAAGALADLDGFEPIVDAAVAVLEPTEAGLAHAARNRMLVINDEVSEDYAEHLADNDDGYTASTYLDAYVDRIRSERGWPVLASHRHRDALLGPWLRALVRKDAIVPPDELQAAAAAASGTVEERSIWTIAGGQWQDGLTQLLLERMIEGHDDAEVRQAALDCFAEQLPGRFPEVVARLVDTGRDARLAQLASELAHRSPGRGADPEAWSQRTGELIAQLPHTFEALAHAELALLQDKQPDLSDADAKVLAAIADPPEDVRAARLRLAQVLELQAQDDARWMLAHTDDHDNALLAINVAAARGMVAIVESTLRHRFAHVAARALKAVADPLAAPLPPVLLELAERTSSPVRLALLDQLEAKPHAGHLPTLRLLAGDEWSKWARQDNDDGVYPVARRAVAAISALDTVPDDVLGELIDRARSSEDIPLVGRMLACAVHHGDAARQEQVVKMSRKGRRIAVGRAAAWALFNQHERLRPETVALLLPEHALRLPATIAGYLTVIMGRHGALGTIESLADGLAASDDRKVFLVLLALGTSDRDPDLTGRIVDRLPPGHVARRWHTEDDPAIERADLIDLGDASAVKEALSWMKPGDA
ncbi:MAG: hypothetical protein B7Z08_00995 [Sphingomonadales bacterium 32-68-7]|nr:MAG: hypothetical protein B7Z33_03330 [Sphingomonadales bacterium 12-68-11]OYX10418.1 MAG: hypothetical protein B7Z08_00995 [Sphingomonadales bacterium 32-68-7]